MTTTNVSIACSRLPDAASAPAPSPTLAPPAQRFGIGPQADPAAAVASAPAPRPNPAFSASRRESFCFDFDDKTSPQTPLFGARGKQAFGLHASRARATPEFRLPTCRRRPPLPPAQPPAQLSLSP